MALPNTGTHARKLENVQIGGGYGSAPDGGLDADAAGNVAMDGDLTVKGMLQANGLLCLGTPATLDILSGHVTVTRSHHLLETEGFASTDDLTHIDGGHVGDIVIFRAVNTARKTTIKDNVGNIRCGADFQLATSNYMMALILEDSGWKCLAKSAN